MKRKIFNILLASCIITTLFIFPLEGGSVHVRGYYRKDGTYVQPYSRSSPNRRVRDNWSYKGSINPYTGEEGTNYYRDNPTSEYYKIFPSTPTYDVPLYELFNIVKSNLLLLIGK